MISKFSKLFFLIFIATLFLSKVESLENAKNPQIISDVDGMHVYAIWARSNGVEDVIQVSSSNSFGSSWSTPITISN